MDRGGVRRGQLPSSRALRVNGTYLDVPEADLDVLVGWLAERKAGA